MLRLLQRPLELHDVRDVEALCQSILDRVLRSWGARLKRDDHEDALSYLIETAWRLSKRYDQAISSITFSTYASRILERRVVDWYRSSPRFMDTRYLRPGEERPRDVSLEGMQEESERGAMLEESDEGMQSAQVRVLTQITCSAGSIDNGDGLERWSSYLQPSEAAA